MDKCTLHILPDGHSIRVACHTLLHEALDRHGITLTAYCDGGGVCGKCIVRIVMADGASVPETAADRRHISGEKRAQGYRLACQWRVSGDATVTVPARSRMGAIRILEDIEGMEDIYTEEVGKEGYGIAVDIGSTTVVATLVDMSTGIARGVTSAMNAQHVYGADVVSRIAYALEERGAATLQRVLMETLQRVIGDVIDEGGAHPSDVRRIVLTGNSVMLHSVHGVSMASLSVAPFSPAFRDARIYEEGVLFPTVAPRAEVWTFPLIDGFVGGDTVACMLAIDMDRTDTPQVMIDIGTNGEVAIGSAAGYITSSAPAGPAFEGARISCGMRGTIGAVEHVTIMPEGMHIEVIGECPPQGICGTGCIDLLAELVSWGIVDASGMMVAPESLPSDIPAWLLSRYQMSDGMLSFCFFDPAHDAYYAQGTTPDALYITQKDVRELQLAKAAISTAYTLLMRRMSLTWDEVAHVSLAGAFGHYLRPAAARRIGLLPDVPLSRLRFIGNAASTGARIALMSDAGRARAERIASEAQHCELAEEADFFDVYAEQMLFPSRIESE